MKILILALLLISASACSKREEIFAKKISPLAGTAIRNLPLKEIGRLTYEDLKKIYLDTCRLNAELLILSNDKPYEPFSDEECIELMDKLVPLAQDLKNKR